MDTKRSAASEPDQSEGESRFGRPIKLLGAIAEVLREVFTRLVVRGFRIAIGLIVAVITLWPASYVVEVLGRSLAELTLGALLGAGACGLLTLVGLFAAWEIAFGARYESA